LTEPNPDGMSDREDTCGLLLTQAAHGDEVAWSTLITRYDRLLWTIARLHGLDRESASDVCQTTWLRLVERMSTLRDPDRVGAWLATTARHEARRTLRRTLREQAGIGQPRSPARVEDRMLQADSRNRLWQAVADLPERCSRLITLLFMTPTPRYGEIAAALDMPVGSIGPTRARCLRRLRSLVDDAGRDIA